MEHVYRTQGENLVPAFIGSMLEIIANCVIKCGGLIHEGNYNIFVNDGEVRFYQSWDEYTDDKYDESFPIYGDDGWLRPEDIGNWADVCLDFEKKYRETHKPSNVYTADQITNVIVELSYSQGSYGRLVYAIKENPDILDEIASFNPTCDLDVIRIIEEGSC